MRLLLFLLALHFFFSACVPAFDNQKLEIESNYTNPDLQKIFTYQDRGNLDSLLYLKQKSEPTYAFAFAKAMASVQDELLIDSLYALLNHNSQKIRSMAAYSIGQTKNAPFKTSLLSAFKTKDTLNVNNALNANILEAIGKIGTANYLDLMSTTSTYFVTDTMLLLGQARGIYQYALRGIISNSGTSKMIEFILNKSYPQEVRMIASDYLKRNQGIDVDSFKFQLVKVLINDKDEKIKINLAQVLNKKYDSEIESYLINQLDIEKSENVLIGLIQSLKPFNYTTSVDKLVSFLSHKNLNLANAAANYFVNNGIPSDVPLYRELFQDSFAISVKAKMISAALKNMPGYFKNTRKIIHKTLEKLINNATDNLTEIYYLESMSYNPSSYEFLLKYIQEKNCVQCKTTAIKSLGRMLKDASFVKVYRSRHIIKRKEIYDNFIKILSLRDAGLSACIADIILDPESKLRDIATEISYFVEARNKCILPKQIETYNKLNEIISFLKNETFIAKTPTYNNPIELEQLNSYTDSTLVRVITSKGNIDLKLFPFEAPGSTANFLKLAKSGFYNNKTFHRVVSNFVIQGGCPRGDGYGALDYSIRTEISDLRYNKKGMVGMASAGKNTEGTQFFITHLPTPHLDGRYTIFGEVTSGLDILNSIILGDKIKEIIIQ